MAVRKNRPGANKTILDMDLVGSDELEAALRALGTDRRWKASMRRSLIKASKPIVMDARARAAKRSGKMARKIDVSSTLSRRQRAQARRRGSKSNPNIATAFIGAGATGPAVLVEFGTMERFTKDGVSKGRMVQEPFIRPAWEGGKRALLKDFERELWLDIAKAAERIRRREMKKAGLK